MSKESAKNRNTSAHTFRRWLLASGFRCLDAIKECMCVVEVGHERRETDKVVLDVPGQFSRVFASLLQRPPRDRGYSQRGSGGGQAETRRRHSGELDFPLLEQPRGALRIHRPAEIISLAIGAAGGKEKVRLSLSLHALGYNLNTKLLGKANCGAHHGGIARIRL